MSFCCVSHVLTELLRVVLCNHSSRTIKQCAHCYPIHAVIRFFHSIFLQQQTSLISHQSKAHMGVFYKQQLSEPGDGNSVSCVNCNTQLALCRDLLSTNFRGRTGGAMLFDKVVNVTTGPCEVRSSGHISCSNFP